MSMTHQQHVEQAETLLAEVRETLQTVPTDPRDPRGDRLLRIAELAAARATAHALLAQVQVVVPEVRVTTPDPPTASDLRRARDRVVDGGAP